MSQKKLNPSAIVALREALTQIYWYKQDLRTFLTNTLANPSILARLNWDDYKRNVVGSLIEILLRNPTLFQADLLTLIEAVCSMDDFSHLVHLDNGKEKADTARKAVQALRKYYVGHQMIHEERKQVEKRKQDYASKTEKVSAVHEKLNELHSDFCQLVASNQPQLRGYELEKLLKQLFMLFDLDPKASFKIIGEQIDGAFSFDGSDYLFEAKWQDKPIGADALDTFASKVNRKLDNTLGLFVSINGFSSDAIKTHSSGRRVLLLMDGGDLATVLEGRIDLKELLLRKRRHAAQTGEIFISVHSLV